MPDAPPRFGFGKPAGPRKAWDHGGKTRQERGYGRDHERIREQLLRDIVLCEECGRNGMTRVGTVADHIIPLAKGGTGDRSNYQLLCADHARAKDARDRGVTPRPKRRIGLSGWPIDD